MSDLCDSCLMAFEDETDSDDLDLATEFMSNFGGDTPDHECETWLYGGVPCPCACHPQTEAASRAWRRAHGVPERAEDDHLESQYEDRYAPSYGD